MFGNNRSHSEAKTRRTWLPNVQRKTFFSEILNRSIPINVTTKTIRCIDKAGGFDNYMVRTRDEFLGHTGSRGVALKNEMLAALGLPANSRRPAVDKVIRQRLGLPAIPIDFNALAVEAAAETEAGAAPAASAAATPAAAPAQA